MPWYYAGPEAKPVGPVTLEELQALRSRGVLTPETYVIEQAGQAGAGLVWKRYADIFPATTGLPPLPPLAPTTLVMPPVPPITPPAGPTHPLFPSAAPGTTQPPIFAPGARPDPYYTVKPTNVWCAWGFGLGLAAFFFAWVCGVGLLPAVLALPMCLVGLMQLRNNAKETGKWLAIWGLCLSSLALVVCLVFALWFAYPMMKAHGMTVTEETTNDSE